MRHAGAGEARTVAPAFRVAYDPVGETVVPAQDSERARPWRISVKLSVRVCMCAGQEQNTSESCAISVESSAFPFRIRTPAICVGGKRAF